MPNANYILFSHVIGDRMFGALERLYAYRNDPTHKLHEPIHLMYKKQWIFHVTRNEWSEVQQMWIECSIPCLIHGNMRERSLHKG